MTTIAAIPKIRPNGRLGQPRPHDQRTRRVEKDLGIRVRARKQRDAQQRRDRRNEERRGQPMRGDQHERRGEAERDRREDGFRKQCVAEYHLRGGGRDVHQRPAWIEEVPGWPLAGQQDLLRAGEVLVFVVREAGSGEESVEGRQHAGTARRCRDGPSRPRRRLHRVRPFAIPDTFRTPARAACTSACESSSRL